MLDFTTQNGKRSGLATHPDIISNEIFTVGQGDDFYLGDSWVGIHHFTRDIGDFRGDLPKWFAQDNRQNFSQALMIGRDFHARRIFDSA